MNDTVNLKLEMPFAGFFRKRSQRQEFSAASRIERQHESFLFQALLSLKIGDLDVLAFGLVLQREDDRRFAELFFILRRGNKKAAPTFDVFVKSIVLVLTRAVLVRDVRPAQPRQEHRAIGIRAVEYVAVPLSTGSQTLEARLLANSWLGNIGKVGEDAPRSLFIFAVLCGGFD